MSSAADPPKNDAADAPTKAYRSTTGTGQWSAVSLLDPPQRSDELGRLAGFRVLKLMGQGGMGVVFRAEDIQLARPVALKVMRPEFNSDPEAGQNFLREARSLAALHDSHVVTIYQAGDAKGVLFLAMEMLQGCTLEQYLDRKKTLTLRQKLRIGRETALGLAAVHRAGMIHRDVKPGNLWLESPTGRVKVLDFGLALAWTMAQGVGTSEVLGTPAYMAPEQIAGFPLDSRCDLFALGVVLYRLITGQLPFAEVDTKSLLARVTGGSSPDLGILTSDVPPPAIALISRLLAREPADRPATAREVADDLHAIERTLSRSNVPQVLEVETAPARHRLDRRWLLGAGVAALGAVALTVWRGINR